MSRVADVACVMHGSETVDVLETGDRVIAHPVDVVWGAIISKDAKHPVDVVDQTRTGRTDEVGGELTLDVRLRGRRYGTTYVTRTVEPTRALEVIQRTDTHIELLHQTLLTPSGNGTLVRSTVSGAVPRQLAKRLGRELRKSVALDLDVLEASLVDDQRAVRRIQRHGSGTDAVGYVAVYVGSAFAVLSIVFGFRVGACLSLLIVACGAADRWSSRRWQAHHIRWWTLGFNVCTWGLGIYVYLGLRTHA